MEHRNSVLIVEDDVNINGLLKEALEKEGYICTQAFSGTEARMILQGERYSVILLDLMLPGIAAIQPRSQAILRFTPFRPR